MVIKLTLSPRTRTKLMFPIFPSLSVIIGEVSSLVCSSRPGKVARTWLPQLSVGTCILAFSVNIETVSAAALLSRHTFQTSDGVTLSILEAGREHVDGSGLTIAYIPGWSMPAYLWQRQIEELGRRYHTLALDPRGQGESQVPDFGYTPERRATDLRDFLQPLSNVLLVGWSLGAIESLQYLEMFGSERLAGLVLVDSSVGEEPAPPPGGNFVQRLRENRDQTLYEFVHAIFKKPRPEDEIASLVLGAKRMALEDSLALLSYPFERTHWRRIVHGFKKPLLYVVTPQFEEQAHNLKKNRPGTQIEVFQTAGHALFVDEPRRFNDLILRFAESLHPPRRK
jgi:non-heme chloroperoxidase